MIGADQLAQLRAALAGTLPDMGTPIPRSEQPDGRGGTKRTDGTPGTAFPCRLQLITREPVEGLVAAQLTSRPPYWLFYPVFYPGVLVPVTLTVAGAVRIGPQTYEIQAVLDPAADTLLNRALVWRESEAPA